MSIFLAFIAHAMRVKGPVGLVCFECTQPVELESFLFTIRKFVVFFVNIIEKSKINLIAISTYTAPHETPWFLRQLTLS